MSVVLALFDVSLPLRVVLVPTQSSFLFVDREPLLPRALAGPSPQFYRVAAVMGQVPTGHRNRVH